MNPDQRRVLGDNLNGYRRMNTEELDHVMNCVINMIKRKPTFAEIHTLPSALAHFAMIGKL